MTQRRNLSSAGIRHSWAIAEFFVRSAYRTFQDPTRDAPNFGFRVATVPEPSTLAIAALGALGLLIAARRKAA